MFQLEDDFKEALQLAASEALGTAPETVPITYPPKPELGDIASPLCFDLARVARKAPRQIAEAIAERFQPRGGIAHIEVAGGGYINGFFDRAGLLRETLRSGFGQAPKVSGGKVIVEHTNINPNKAAHIGHLRNAVLGDTLVRFLAPTGPTRRGAELHR